MLADPGRRRGASFRAHNSMGPTGGGDVSDCVHYGVVIAVFSGGVGKPEGRIAKCTFTL